MQNNPAVRTLLTTCVALAVLAAGIYLYINRAPTGTTSQTLSDGTVVSGLPAGAVVTEEPSAPQPYVPQPAVAAPDYRKAVTYDASVTDEVRATIESRVAADVALLAKNPQNFSAWMDLAILHKIGGDYRGAEAIWLYVTKAWPKSYVAFHNLGDLYQNFLKDSVKAKFYSDQAVKLGAGQ